MKLSTTYSVQAGDTFEIVSRRAYGSEQYASNLAKANPGAFEPLAAGTVLTIPPVPGAPQDKNAEAPAGKADEVAVLIDGKRFRYWSQLRITRSLDAMDTVEFSAPFDSKAPGFRETFKPFSYKPLVVTVGGATLFTGTMVGVSPSLVDTKTIQVSAYSAPGVLNDCTPPASAFPLEFDNMDLSAIASALCAPFGISPEFTGPSGALFERVAASPSDTVLDFLSDLARQRGLVVSSTPDGKLLFQVAGPTGQPVAVLTQGAPPVMGVVPSFSPQQYYSHITGLESVLLGTEGSQYTVKNPHLAGVVRPLTFESPDVEGGDLTTAVAAKIGRMYGNMASYALTVNTWRDPSGKLWTPNTTLKLEAPDAMIYSSYEFTIRSVRFDRDGSREAAELDLVLPGSFKGENPEALPWA